MSKPPSIAGHIPPSSHLEEDLHMGAIAYPTAGNNNETTSDRAQVHAKLWQNIFGVIANLNQTMKNSSDPVTLGEKMATTFKGLRLLQEGTHDPEALKRISAIRIDILDNVMKHGFTARVTQAQNLVPQLEANVANQGDFMGQSEKISSCFT